VRPLLLAAVAALSTTACVLVEPRHGHAITRAEAVEIALQYSTSHGYRAEVRRAERNDEDWRVRLRALPPYAGELEIELNTFGAVVSEHGGFEHYREREHHEDRDHHEHRDHHNHHDDEEDGDN
jgi:hypothetical protein